MDWRFLIQDNFDIILGGIIALVSGSIGFLGQFVYERWSKGLELKQKQLEWQKEYREQQLTNPVIRFTDEMLQFMDDIYWTTMDGQEPKNFERLASLRNQEGIIKARVAAFGDEKLSDAFDQLTCKYGLFRNRIGEGDVGEAFNELKEARQIAGTIFDRIGPKLPR